VRIELEKEILLSWERCIKKDISARLISPRFVFQKDTFLQNYDNALLITIFERVAESISRFITTDYMLFLTDPDGVLLAKTGTKNTLNILSRSGIETGVSFSEESCGTNAISLAIKLKQPVYLAPKQHFCDILKNWHGYAVPLEVGGLIKGYLDFSTIEQAMQKELIAITQLLGEKIMNEYGTTVFSEKSREIRLNSQQLVVLKLISQGLTMEAVALETGISVNTVKYHKKKVFRELGVQSTGEAVAKAINAGLI
jgi:transcriptional regulator of acetoin/glycerol metabolism